MLAPRRLAALLLLSLAAPAAGSIAVAVPIEELARRADAVVLGRVVESVAHRARDGRSLYTRIRIAPIERWKGPEGELVLVEPGGEVGNLGQRVLGVPRFEVGEEVVVFARRRGEGVYELIGLSQGKFRVERGLARQDLTGLALARQVPGGAMAIGEHGEGALSLPLDALRGRVRAALAGSP